MKHEMGKGALIDVDGLQEGKTGKWPHLILHFNQRINPRSSIVECSVVLEMYSNYVEKN